MSDANRGVEDEEELTSRRSRPASASLIHPNHTPIAPAARLGVLQEIENIPLTNSAIGVFFAGDPSFHRIACLFAADRRFTVAG